MNLSWLRANWDRALAWLLIVVGLVVLYVGWERSSDEVYPAAQLPFIVSGGIGGALLVVLGATLLISADLRDQWHKLHEISTRLASDTPAGDATEGATPVGVAVANGSGERPDEPDDSGARRRRLRAGAGTSST
jgi:hypothetical protein